MRKVLAEKRPDLVDPIAEIRAGRVFVDGRPVTNPDSLVFPTAHIVVRQPGRLRGEEKLRPALEAFAIDARDRIALDIGAAAGGFTRVLLEAGVRRVYALDAGYGQLLGSLRQDPRVVSLERVNLGDLDRTRVRDAVSLVTIDVSYLSLAEAVPQLDRIAIAEPADLVALVKPMFELALPAPPPDELLGEAVRQAEIGIESASWTVVAGMRCPVMGARGTREFLLHAVRPNRPPGSKVRRGEAALTMLQAFAQLHPRSALLGLDRRDLPDDPLDHGW